MADPGWYPDPRDPGLDRWFDGSAWTEQVRAAAPMPPPTGEPVHLRAPAPPRSRSVGRHGGRPLLAFVAVMAVVSAVAGAVVWATTGSGGSMSTAGRCQPPDRTAMLARPP